MVDRLLFRNAVHRRELLVGDLSGVAAEGVHFGDVPLEEELQLPDIDEPGGVADYRREETLVLLVALELRLPVVPSGDDHRLETYAIPEDVHVREEAQLPLRVLHRLRDDDLELQVHLPVTFRHVAETGGDHGRVDDVVRHHLPVLVLHGVHEEHLLTVESRHADGVPAVAAQCFHLRKEWLLVTELQRGGHVAPREALGLAGHSA